MQNKLSWAA